MHRQTVTRRGLALLMGAVLATLPSVMTPPAAAVAPPAAGIVCTTDPSLDPSFTLTTRDGYVQIPDGNTIYMWGYSGGGGDFQLPGPTLCVDQDPDAWVTITLDNTLPEAVSIVLPGQTGVEASEDSGTTWDIAAPQFDGPTLTSLTNVAEATTGSVMYRFHPSEPGTYIYESGTDPGKQVQMGLYGALVIRPAGHADWAYDNAGTKFNTGTEFVMLLSEVDPDLHQAVERDRPYDVSAYHPRYWMINGRSFPDTIAANGAPWLPSQPYGALVHIEPYDAGTNPDPALIRYLNVGQLNHPFHPHGNHGRIIARDGRLLSGSADEDLSYEKFLVLVGAGQTWDSTFTFTDVEHWSPANPVPVTIPQLQNLTFKDDATWYSGSPYLGEQDELPTGVTSYNQCGEFYHVAHSHALNEAANFDAGFGGMLTLIRIDPPDGCP